MAEEQYEELTRFDNKIKGVAASLKSKIGKRANDESTFHDSFTFEAQMGLELMMDVLGEMHVSNPAFIAELPDEVPSIELPGCHFEDHSLKITAGGKAVCRMDSVEILKFVVTRDSDTVFKLSCVVKGVPELKEHFNLERVMLDCHAGSKFQFEFGSPVDVQADLYEDAPIPSNVTNMGTIGSGI